MNNEVITQLEKMLNFAYEYRLALVPHQPIIKKAELVVKLKHCPCMANRLECPCKECLDEVYSEAGKCYCKVFCTYAYADAYLKEFFYIDSNGKPILDTDRKQLNKKKEDAERIKKLEEKGII